MSQPTAPNKSALTSEAVREVLATCIDPELNIDIVSLGLIYDITVDKNKIGVVMTLTTPTCPLAPFFQQDIADRCQNRWPNVKTTVTFTFTPPWDTSRIAGPIKKLLPIR